MGEILYLSYHQSWWLRPPAFFYLTNNIHIANSSSRRIRILCKKFKISTKRCSSCYIWKTTAFPQWLGPTTYLCGMCIVYARFYDILIRTWNLVFWRCDIFCFTSHKSPVQYQTAAMHTQTTSLEKWWLGNSLKFNVYLIYFENASKVSVEG